ncbi:hypothetical protein BJ741DRAFT_607685 [Chytriomyces cf. hyalinus JEL632]|nr:hypothetical protein BJ741DRAFT_607685 [Chytriomyces cf. hyalinus JEL632]
MAAATFLTPFVRGFSLNAGLIVLLISFWKIGTDQDRTILYSIEVSLLLIAELWHLFVVLKERRAKKAADEV